MDRWGLWHLATGDAAVIAQCRSRTRRLFLTAGIGAGLVCMLTPFSIYLVFEQAFRLDAMAGVLAVLFSVMLLNIYRLTLASVHVNDLPGSKSGTRGRLISLGVRGVLVCGLAFFLAAPLATYVFQEEGGHIAQDYRAVLRADLERLSSAHLDRIHVQYAAAVRSGDKRSAALIALGEERFKQDYRKRIAALDDNGFFIKRIQELYRNEWRTWALAILIGSVFLLPILLKTLAVNRGDHRVLIRARETALITSAYDAFREEYQRLFQEEELIVEWQCTYLDPPFNTIRPPRPEAQDQEAFKTWMKDMPWP